MKVLWLSFSFLTAEPWHVSLDSLREHETHIHWYDRFTPPDQACLDAANRVQPDVIIYTGMADWAKTPSCDTFHRLRKIAPIIHISGDLSDPPYIPYLQRYDEEKCFDLTVNIDGNDEWPYEGNRLTLLSPTAPSFYERQKPLSERPIELGFAGGHASPSRWEILSHLVENAGLTILPRVEKYGTYQRYADFMTMCQIVVNVPFSGSDAVRQVKGRVLECGQAGCVLLDHKESWARKWFRPDVDYAVYRDKEHAVEIVKELLDHPRDMEDLANNLMERVSKEHGPKQFWERVFGKL